MVAPKRYTSVSAHVWRLIAFLHYQQVVQVSKFMNFPFTWLLLWGVSVNSLLLLAVSSSHNPYMAPLYSNNHKGTRSIFKTHFVPFKMC